MNILPEINEIVEEISNEVGCECCLSNPLIVSEVPLICFDTMHESLSFKDVCGNFEIWSTTIGFWVYSHNRSEGFSIKEKIINKMHSYGFVMVGMSTSKNFNNDLITLRFRAKIKYNKNNTYEIYQ